MSNFLWIVTAVCLAYMTQLTGTNGVAPVQGQPRSSEARSLVTKLRDLPNRWTESCKKSTMRLKGGNGEVGIAHRQEMVKRARSFELLRTKSFGELSTLEYEAMVKRLSHAAERGDIQECVSLIKQGAWPNHILFGEKLQVNALHMAAMNGHAKLCRVLVTGGEQVELGADIHLPNRHGYTALHLASQLGHLEAVKELVAMGADLEAEDLVGDTAADKALLGDHDDVATFLQHVAREDQDSILRVKHRWRREWVPTRAERSHFIAGHHENPMLENL